MLNEDLLLQGIEPFDFKELAGLPPQAKISRQIREVLIAQVFYENAKDNGCYFCIDNNCVYLFNGSYWEEVVQRELAPILAEAAVRMGCDYVDVMHHQFKDNVHKQFVSILETPQTEPLGTRVLINLRNGTYEVTEAGGELREANADDFIKYQLSFDYDSQARAPMFEAYLNEVLPDKSCQDVLAEYVGYLFVKGLKLEKILILYGSGANGKSVFAGILTALLGESNVSAHSLSDLTKEATARIGLSKVLVNYATEISGKMETSIFKQLASNEPVIARHLYCNPVTMRNYAKLIFNCNELPRDIEQTDAFYRRFIIVPFTTSIPKEKQDPYLIEKITSKELSGIFNWALKGLSRLLENQKFTESEIVKEQVERFRVGNDSILMFLEENSYYPGIEMDSRVALKEIYKDYQWYCRSNGFKICSSKRVSARLERNGYMKERLKDGTYFRITTYEKEFENNQGK